jgi:predicted permease
MFDVILQAAGLIAAGVLWRLLTPLGLDADELRANLTGLVYVLLLPALVLVVLWRAPLSLDAVRVGIVAALGIATGFLAAWVWFRSGRLSSYAIGAALLAAAFPNATYLGLPVLEASLGPWARSIAVQYDLFACTRLLLSAGVLVAARYGGVVIEGHPALALLRVPPLWAAVAGVSLNVAAVPLPNGFGHWLDMLAAGVVPLMLFALGLGLRWCGGWGERIPALWPVVAIQLLLMPLVAWGAGAALGLHGETLTAVALEGAMPSMVLGVVICDRYRLDTTLYAAAVTLSTALSMITLPFWFEVLQG